jgi:hypothetical protein
MGPVRHDNSVRRPILAAAGPSGERKVEVAAWCNVGGGVEVRLVAGGRGGTGT